MHLRVLISVATRVNVSWCQTMRLSSVLYVITTWVILDHHLPILTEIVLGKLEDIGKTIESSDQVHTSWVINILVKEIWVLVISARRVYREITTVLVLVVPNHILSVSVDFEHLQVVFHNERYVIVRLLIIHIRHIVMNSTISGVPRNIGVGGSVKF